MSVRPGLEVLLDDPRPIYGKNIGLVTNQSAVTSDLRHAVRLLHAGRGWKLAALFGPEHGIWGEAQDMEGVEQSTDPLTGLTVYSLYGRNEKDLAPRREVLKTLDALVIDLQDIGSRYYTFIYTMALCMREAAPLGVQVIVLDRPRHAKLIADIRATGARIRLIGDGDLSAGIAAAVVGSGVHAVMGTGGAPEGVLTAAAMRCLNGEILARLVVDKPEHEERCRAMGVTDFKKIYRAKDLAPGHRIIFAATGVTDGALMRGVRFFGDGTRTSSLIMQNQPHRIRFIDSIHVADAKDVRIRF